MKHKLESPIFAHAFRISPIGAGTKVAEKFGELVINSKLDIVNKTLNIAVRQDISPLGFDNIVSVLENASHFLIDFNNIHYEPYFSLLLKVEDIKHSLTLDYSSNGVLAHQITIAYSNLETIEAEPKAVQVSKVYDSPVDHFMTPTEAMDFIAKNVDSENQQDVELNNVERQVDKD